MKKVIMVIICVFGFLSLTAFSNDFIYTNWKNSHSKAVYNFRNHFFREIFDQIFGTAKPNNIQISSIDQPPPTLPLVNGPSEIYYLNVNPEQFKYIVLSICKFEKKWWYSKGIGNGGKLKIK